jgi:hypothetical protein
MGVTPEASLSLLLMISWLMELTKIAWNRLRSSPRIRFAVETMEPPNAIASSTIRTVTLRAFGLLSLTLDILLRRRWHRSLGTRFLIYLGRQASYPVL